MPPSSTVIAHLALKELPMRCAAVCMADAPVILQQRRCVASWEPLL
jgi:hypothetical protein